MKTLLTSWTLVIVPLAVFLCLNACGTSKPAETPAWIERVENEFPDGEAYKINPAPASDRLPDIVLITVDTLRADATGFSGAGKVKTPGMDRLAEAGVVFPFAHAHAVTTLPSHSSMLTGLLPYQHGVRDNAGFVLSDEPVTLAAHLKVAGYRTGAFISAFPLDARFGLDRGFDVYDDRYQGYGNQDFVFPERPARETVDSAMRWFQEDSSQPRFLWLHLFTPHFPYEPEPPFDTEYASAPYYGEAATSDARLMPLFDALTADGAPESIVVLTSDHGEGLGEHGELTHGTFAYESTLRVPFFVWSPARLLPGITDVPARHIDIFPTVCALAELDIPTGLAGRDLFAPLPDGYDDGHYFEALMTHLNHGWAPLFGRIDGGYKAINLPRSELYDLRLDPAEAQNLLANEGLLHAALLEPLPDMFDALITRQALSEEEIEKLQSLGYAVSEGGGNLNDVDPKDMIAADQRLKAALRDHQEGRTPLAVRQLYAIVNDVPSFEPAYRDLTFILQEIGRIPDAAALLTKAKDAGLKTEALARRGGNVMSQMGRFDEALAWLQPYAESQDPDTHRTFGKVLAGMQRFAEAEQAFQKALTLDKTNPDANVDLGVLYLNMQRGADAESRFRAALEEDPGNARAWNGLGVIAASADKDAQAAKAFAKSFSVQENFVDGYLNLALIQIRREQNDAARTTLQRALQYATGSQRERVQQMLARINQGN